MLANLGVLFDFKKAFSSFLAVHGCLQVPDCSFSTIHDVRSLFKMPERVSRRWIAHTSRNQLGPCVSPFSFQPIWLDFSTLLVHRGSQMDCCQGRWIRPSWGGGGARQRSRHALLVDCLIPRTSPPHLLVRHTRTPEVPSKHTINFFHLVPSRPFWLCQLLCRQHSLCELGSFPHSNHVSRILY